MNRPSYPTDLTDAQWKILAPQIPPAKPSGRPRGTDMREVINAIFLPAAVGLCLAAFTP